MITSWAGEPLDIAIVIDRIEKKDLPVHLGKSPLLDKEISKCLCASDDSPVWVANNRILSSVISELFESIDADSIEIEIYLCCSGCICPGRWDDPPDYEDERDITSVVLNFDNESKPVGDSWYPAFFSDFKREIYGPRMP